MILVFILWFFNGARALQVHFTPPTRVAVGELLTVRCSTNKNDGSVWALHFSFRNSSNSFQILRRTDGSASIFLTSDGYPMRFEKSMSYRGGIETEEPRDTRAIQLRMRINTATNGSDVTCKEILFGEARGDRRTRKIVVSRRPSVVFMLAQRHSSRRRVSKITAVPAGSSLKMECQAYLGSPPVSSDALFLVIGPTRFSSLFAQCDTNDSPTESNGILCRWNLMITKRVSEGSAMCIIQDKKKYRFDETKLMVYESVSLMMEGNIYACDRSDYYETTIHVKTSPKVTDIVAPLIEETQRKFKDCNITNWRLRRNIGYYTKTGEKVIQMKRDWAHAFVNLNGSFVTNDLDDIRGLKFHRLRSNEIFFHVKDYVNVVDIFGDKLEETT